MSAPEARRLAHVRLGGVDQIKERWRATRPFYWFGPWWLDVKLGLRMLVKHPSLAAVSIFALAVGIPVGLAPTHLTSTAIETPLPVENGDRIRLVRHRDVANARTAPTTSYDLGRWQAASTTFQTLGASRSAYYNLNSYDESGEPVTGAEVTASTFRMLRVPPLHGRALITVDIGRVPHTVVGIMPREFLFPSRHQLWLPLRALRILRASRPRSRARGVPAERSRGVGAQPRLKRSRPIVRSGSSAGTRAPRCRAARHRAPGRPTRYRCLPVRPPPSDVRTPRRSRDDPPPAWSRRRRP